MDLRVEGGIMSVKAERRSQIDSLRGEESVDEVDWLKEDGQGIKLELSVS